MLATCAGRTFWDNALAYLQEAINETLMQQPVARSSRLPSPPRAMQIGAGDRPGIADYPSHALGQGAKLPLKM